MAIEGLIGLFQTLSRIYDRVAGNSDGSTLGEVMKTIKVDEATITLAKSGGNMVNMLKPMIIEPSIFITKTANSRTDINSIAEHAVDVYAAFYVQAFKVLSNIYHLPTGQVLNILANKGFEYEAYKNNFDLAAMDIESFVSLPLSLDKENLEIELKKQVQTVKSDDIIPTKTIIRSIDILLSSDLEVKRETPDDDVEKKLSKLTANIPLIIKANIHVTELDTIANSVEHKASSAGFFKRFLQWKVGVISFKDFVLAGDLIAKYKEGILTKDNFAKELGDSAGNHINVQALLDKRIGLNKMVFTYIMTDDELDLLGKRMGYNINKAGDKDKLMNALLSLNITSINQDRDLVTVYVNGISGMSSSPIKKLSKGGKDGDAIEVLAAALMANKPSFF